MCSALSRCAHSFTYSHATKDMDTGGFFVALLKKVKPLSKDATERMNRLARESKGGDVDTHLNKPKACGSKESGESGVADSSAAEDKTDTATASACEAPKSEQPEDASGEKEEVIRKAPQGKVGVHHNHKKDNNKCQDLGSEDFLPVNDSLWPDIEEEFGLDPATLPKDQFMVRSDSKDSKVIYFITKSIKEQLIDRGIQDRVTVINSGLKAFERSNYAEGHRRYRLAQEGVHYVIPHLTKRVLTAGMDDFAACMKEGYLSLDTFTESFQKKLDDLNPGSFVVMLEGYEKDVSKKMFLVMWRREKKFVTCFVTKIERDAIVSKMGALGFVPPTEEEKLKDEPASDCVAMNT